jgi:hypothetical protein
MTPKLNTPNEARDIINTMKGSVLTFDVSTATAVDSLVKFLREQKTPYRVILLK